MGLFSKVANTGSSTDWRVTKKVWAKVNSGWVAATGVFGKTISGWVKMWPGNAPSVRLSDPINIRLGGYNGTIATSPQLFASTNQGTSGTFLKLWGNDGSFDGVTPITISNRRMLCSDNIDGQVERFSLSGNDTIDFATTSQATRDLAEGYYIFYQLLATNVDGSLDAYSPPIKVIKRKPALVSTSLLSESGGTLTVSGTGVIEVNAQVRWGWWIRPGGYLGGTPVLRWWKNTSRSPGGTLLKEINIETGYNYVSGSIDPNYIYDTNTSNVLTIYNNIGGGNSLQSGEYIIAELYLENSYTAHHAAPAIYWAATGEAAIPTITSLTALAPTTSSTQLVTVTVNWASTNQASYNLSVTQTGVASYNDTGTTQTSSNTADSGSLFRVYSGASVSILLTLYSGPNQTGRSATQTITYTPPLVQQYTVTWSGTGGSTGNEGIPWEFTAGGSVTVPSVSRIGYTFLRWTDTPSGDYTYTTTGGTFFPPSQNITMYARWQINVCTIPNVIGMTEASASTALNNAGFLYEFTYYVNTTNSSLNGTVQAVDPEVGTQPGCGSNVALYIYSYVPTTYGPCEFWYTSSTYECSSLYNRDIYTTYYKRKVYVNGVWDGSTYDYSESACTPTVTYGSYVLTDGRCGYTAPSYQYYCRTNYYQSGIPDDTYTSSYDQSEVVCSSYRTVCSYNNTGSYPSASNPPACATTTTTTTTTTACTCFYEDMGTYHYSSQCCPGGSPRTGSLSGTTTNACCPNVTKPTTTTTAGRPTVYWQCNQSDVNNYSNPCSFVGQCRQAGNTYLPTGCTSCCD